MMSNILAWLVVAFLGAMFLRVCLGCLPRWLIVAIAALLLGQLLHPRVVEDILDAASGLLDVLVVLFLTLIGLRWFFGFSRRRKSS